MSVGWGSSGPDGEAHRSSELCEMREELRMSLFWSLKGTKFWGRAYWKTVSASIFLNTIYQHSDSFSSFILNLTFVMFHEYLHLFFKFELGKYQNSCKTIIDPLSWILSEEMARDPVFVQRIVNDFMEISETKRARVIDQDIRDDDVESMFNIIEPY